MNSINLNGYSFELLSNNTVVEKVIYKNANYYALPVNSAYKVRLTNNTAKKADAHIWLGDDKLGVWRVNPYSRITVDHPAYKLQVDKLVKVEFKPEKISTYNPQTQNNMVDPTETNYLCHTYTDTVTPYGKSHRTCALSDYNYDRYVAYNLSPRASILQDIQPPRRVEPITDVDQANITTIYTRLIVDNDVSTSRREYIHMRESNSNNNQTTIPPPIDLEHPARPRRNINNNYAARHPEWYFQHH